MGLMDSIRGLFSGSKNNQSVQTNGNDEYKKSMLADRIVDLVDKIKRINSFDNSIWNLSNVSSYDLRRKSLEELQMLNSSLENRLSVLDKQSQRVNTNNEELEASKWTGQKPQHLNENDFDRFQRSDDGRY